MPSRTADSSAMLANGISDDRSIRCGWVRANHASSRARRSSNGKARRSSAPSNRMSYSRTWTGKSFSILAPTTLRPSRCCRSANGATCPSRITSNSPSSTASKSIAVDDFGKRARDILRPAGIHPAPAGHGDQLGADAVPFPLGPEGGGVQRGEVRRLQRLRQHQRAEHRCARRVGAVPVPLQPGEQRQVGRRQPVPHLLDLVRRDPPPGKLRQRDLGQPGGRPHAQAAGDQLQQRIAAGRIRRVQPPGDDLRQVGLRGADQRLDHVRHARRRLVRGPRRPHQRDRVRQVPHIVVRPGEQHRVGPRLRQAPDQHRLGRRERQLAGQRSEREAAVGIGLGREIAPQQGDLGQATRREDEAVEEFGKGDHGCGSIRRMTAMGLGNLAQACRACFTAPLPCWGAMAAPRLCPFLGRSSHRDHHATL